MLKIKDSSVLETFSNRDKAKEALSRLKSDELAGFVNLHQRESLFTSAEKRAHEIKMSHSKLVIIGIGGSSLGPQLLKDLYDHKNCVFILDNLDPFLLKSFYSWAGELNQIHVLIISKSGKTLETLVLAEQLIYDFKKMNLDLSRHFTVITENQSQDLSMFAFNNNIPTLELPVDVGGRYSVLTPVGTLLMAFLDQDLNQVRSGMSEALGSPDLVEQLIALALTSFEQNCLVTPFWSYSSALRNYGAWMQQLWSESLGKPGAKVSTFMPLVGAIDQHSVLQQLIEGDLSHWSCLLYLDSNQNNGPMFKALEFASLRWAANKPIGVILNAECFATYEGLRVSGKNVTLIQMQDLSPKTIGFLLMVSQLWVAGIGYAVDINPFNQPGVELGKRLVKSLV